METSSLSSIPEAKRDSVEKALKTAFATSSVDSITLLAGGLSSALVYRMVVQGKPYLLRIALNVHEFKLNIHAFHGPAQEFACMKIASEGGVAPSVHYADVESAVVITDFIEAKSFREHFTSPDAMVTELANTIKSIHALPPFPGQVDHLEGVEGYIQEFKASGMLPESATEEHFRLYAEIPKVYPRDETDLVSSHNDLNPNNILFDGTRFWIIDWEVAIRNDRYVDLAGAANFLVHGEPQEEAFLRTYFGDSLNDYRRARFFLMQQVCLVLVAVIFMKLAGTMTPPGVLHDAGMETPAYREFFAMIGSGSVSLASYEGQLLCGKVLLNRALSNMKSARFEASLAKMREAHP